MTVLSNGRQLLRITWPLLAAVIGLLAISRVSSDIMSAVRAYLIGESHWSKGQKDCLFYLLEYARGGEPSALAQARSALSVPLGDRQARLALQARPRDREAALRGFAQGRVPEGDIPGVINLFIVFGDTFLMAPSIDQWTQGDAYIERLQQITDELEAAMGATPRDPVKISELVERIEGVNRELTPLTVRFSDELANAARRTQQLLVALMLLAALVLVPVGLVFAGRFMQRSAAVVREKEALQREVDIASRIQTAILPPVGGMAHLDIAARMKPAASVGGDCYDIQPAPGGCWIAIGDVAGHGLSTGLVTLMTQSALASVTRFSPHASPSSVVTTINTVLHENVRQRMRSDDHVTFVLMRFFDDGRLVHAGSHEEFVVWRARSGKCEIYPTRGTWLGPLHDISRLTPENELRLEAGDLLVLYTDGVVEAAGPAREEFGQERLCSIIEQYARAPVGEVVAAIFDGVHQWAPRQDDDVTAVVLRYQSNPTPAAQLS